MYQQITYEVDGPSAVITLNRPEALNALTNNMMEELKHALGAAEKDSSVVGIVLTGAGRGFCSGMDMNAQEGNRHTKSCCRTIDRGNNRFSNR